MYDMNDLIDVSLPVMATLFRCAKHLHCTRRVASALTFVDNHCLTYESQSMRPAGVEWFRQWDGTTRRSCGHRCSRGNERDLVRQALRGDLAYVKDLLSARLEQFMQCWPNSSYLELLTTGAKSCNDTFAPNASRRVETPSDERYQFDLFSHMKAKTPGDRKPSTKCIQVATTIATLPLLQYNLTVFNSFPTRYPAFTGPF